MVWAHTLLGVLPWMANPAQIDQDRGEVRLAHCTVPRSLVRGYRLRSHFESGLGVGIEGEMEPGDVTLIRIGGPQLERLQLAEGESLPAGILDGVCRTQMLVRLTTQAARGLLEDPLGNHLVMVRGHHEGRLRQWWRTMIALTAS